VSPRPSEPARRRVGTLAAAGLGVVVAFQVALALGVPWGIAAQGGTNPGRLPDGLRILAAFGGVVWAVAVVLVLGRSGVVRGLTLDAVSRRGTWVVAGLLSLGAVLNFASSSPRERFGGGPYTLVLLGLVIVLARGGTQDRQ
jgi:hypothetical protein